MPRRVADYLPCRRLVTTLNMISTIGAFILGVSTLPFLWNVFKTWRYGERVTVDDPWGYGNSLEWATSCPPPRHNFTDHPADPLRAAGVRAALPAHQERAGRDSRGSPVSRACAVSGCPRRRQAEVSA